MLLAVNYRPEYRHAWSGKSYYRLLRIDPLRPASATELLVSLLGSDKSLDALKQLIIERTEGNPFFIEESVRTLVETGVLAGERLHPGGPRTPRSRPRPPDSWPARHPLARGQAPAAGGPSHRQGRASLRF
jgi:hypothetical protein